MRRGFAFLVGALFAISALRAETPVYYDPNTIAFLEKHGCTIGPQSLAAAPARGIDTQELLDIAKHAHAAGNARLEISHETIDAPRYTVLSNEICLIRLPEIDAVYTKDHPIFPTLFKWFEPDEQYPIEPWELGCYLDGGVHIAMEELADLSENYTPNYFAFLGRGVIDGSLTFFSPTLLSTAVGIQSLVGECANVPWIEAIRRAQKHHNDIDFNNFIRAISETTQCGDTMFGWQASQLSNEIQGLTALEPRSGDIGDPSQPDTAINAWLHLEYFFVAYAAGWFENSAEKPKGVARPPVCSFASAP